MAYKSQLDAARMAMYKASLAPRAAATLTGNSGPTFAAREPDIPVEPPNLIDQPKLQVDFETDGVKWYAGDRPGGVGVGLPTGETWYLAWGHQGGGNNISKENAIAWMQDNFRGKRITNISTKFEVHMGRELGVNFEDLGCEVSDIAHWTAMIDDQRQRRKSGDDGETAFSLAALCIDFLGEEERKITAVGGVKLDPSKMMLYPASVVGVRAMADVRQVGLLEKRLWPRLDSMGLQKVRALEDDVIFAACEMEMNGAPIDLEKLERWERESAEDLDVARKAVSVAVGVPLQKALLEGGKDGDYLNPDSNKDMQFLFERLGLPIFRTDSGSASFTKDVIASIQHPVLRLLEKQSTLLDLRAKYLVPYLEAVKRDGKLRFSLHQCRGDEKGTTRGRFSASDKNIQQVMKPKKQRKTYGDKYIIRELFIAPPGCPVIVSADADQVEYRIFASYANKPSIIEAYRQNPNIDFHQLIGDDIKKVMPNVDRDGAKTCNFLCVAADTPILCADLTWRPAGVLIAGDQLLAFDEHQGAIGKGRERTRRWRLSSVLENVLIEKECLEIEFDDGKRVVCTPDHRWLAYRNADRVSLQWIRSDQLVIGKSRVQKISQPWIRDESWEAGWLAGFMDGEGNVSREIAVSLGQNQGPALDFAAKLLRTKYNQITRSNYTDVLGRIGLRGTVHERMRFLGTIRPGRLISNFAKYLDGKMFQAQTTPRVVAVREVGLQKIAALGTSSATYIANGYAAHNTVYGGGLAKLALALGTITSAQFTQLNKEFPVSPAEGKFGPPREHPWLAAALEIKKIYERVLPEAKTLAKDATKIARERGYVCDCLGRRATFPGGEGAHAALNAVIQPSAAEINKIKVVEVHRIRKQTGLIPLMTVHDEHISGAPNLEAVQALNTVLNRQSFKFRVPITWDTRWGKNWSELGRNEDQFKGTVADGTRPGGTMVRE